ncbi:hypothetical protein FAF44_02595 [Nonomuraea sp. MG754425]|uniref:hypothetical protein n=1 Tax=Nonomuraea sp. MG754425 TaxID=2570319 RepID=UPI001F349CBF|nr:hypothetical protein [Nonomuraea sp. MG754425]MCF6467302.1 hypothetical protein [Nonomuraea sp. MG754425]
MSYKPDLLTTHALLARWEFARCGERAHLVFTLKRDAWTIRVTFEGDEPKTAELLRPGTTTPVTIDMSDVGRWLKTSRTEAALHKVGDRVTVAGRAGTIVGFELEERPPAAGPWKFRLAVVYDDGVNGDPFPASAATLDPAPAEAGECKGWLCGGVGAVMCLTREYTRDDSAPLERKVLCDYHAEYGDRRLVVVRVLHEIPAPAASAAVEKG